MGNAPRVVVVTRATEYEELLARHGTRALARFFLQARGQDIEALEGWHRQHQGVLREVLARVPLAWRRVTVLRHDLDRFLFEPEDTIVVVGQDGLVANVAKYLDGQLVLGINPSPERNAGVLVRMSVEQLDAVLVRAAHRDVEVEQRTMVSAELDDGQRLHALNEIFVGHRSHQTARYDLAFGDRTVHHASSGVVVASGTGATGWAWSIHRERRTVVELPCPTEARLAFFVREAFSSRTSSTDLSEGTLPASEKLELVSRMNDGGVVFGDGIEDDQLDFGWGMRLTLRAAARSLALVCPPPEASSSSAMGFG